eukprot:1146831-Pelagomonas_calceolata.AAC.3
MIKRAQMAHRVHRTLTTLSMSSGRLGAARADELLYEVFPEKASTRGQKHVVKFAIFRRSCSRRQSFCAAFLRLPIPIT